MASKAEQILCQSLRAILADVPSGANIEQTEQYWNALGGLEFCLSSFLGPDWHDTLDGFCPILFRKTGDGEAELVGLCILLSDQTLAPIHLRLQIASNTDRISWLECRVGENGKHGMIRTPYGSLNETLRRMYEYCFLTENANKIDWVHNVTFGKKRP